RRPTTPPLFPYTTLFRSLADRLRDGDDMGFGEGAVQGRATMAAGAEADELLRIADIGEAGVVFVHQPAYVDEQFGWSRFAGERRSEEHTSELQSRGQLGC